MLVRLTSAIEDFPFGGRSRLEHFSNLNRMLGEGRRDTAFESILKAIGYTRPS